MSISLTKETILSVGVKFDDLVNIYKKIVFSLNEKDIHVNYRIGFNVDNNFKPQSFYIAIGTTKVLNAKIDKFPYATGNVLFKVHSNLEVELNEPVLERLDNILIKEFIPNVLYYQLNKDLSIKPVEVKRKVSKI